MGEAVVGVGGAALVGGLGARWEVAVETAGGFGGAHPVKEHGVVFGCKGQVVAEDAKELDCSARRKPVAVLEGSVAVEGALAVEKVEAGDAERGDVVVDDLRAAGETKEEVGGGVVAEGDGHLEKVAEGDIDAGVEVLVLQGAVGLGEDEVGL